MQVDTFSLRQLLSTGQFEEALEQLSKAVIPAKFRNDLILLESQWEESQHSFGANLIDYEQHSRERSRLIVGLLNLLDRMESDFFAESAVNPELYFFESPFTKIEEAARVYARVFPQATTRTIYWELRLLHSAVAGQLDFDLSYELYHPDNSLMGHNVKRCAIQPGWADSYFPDGWGWEAPGKYPPGQYTVKTFLNGKQVAEGVFEISA